MAISPLALHESIALLVEITSVIAYDVYYNFNALNSRFLCVFNLFPRLSKLNYSILVVDYQFPKSTPCLDKNVILMRPCFHASGHILPNPVHCWPDATHKRSGNRCDLPYSGWPER